LRAFARAWIRWARNPASQREERGDNIIEIRKRDGGRFDDLTLRRTVSLHGENRPNDSEVIYQGRTVGRIYRMHTTGR
jgi:hypothetical protein